MLEAPLKRNKTLPNCSWDAPRTLQDAPGRLLDSVWGVTWRLLGPSWAPRRPQDATKTYPRAAQNTSQDALGSPRPPRTSKTSKMTPKSRWGTPRGLVFLEPTWVHLGPFWRRFWGTFAPRVCTIFTSMLYHLCSLFSIFWRRFWMDQGKRGGGLAALRRFGYIYIYIYSYLFIHTRT